MKWKRAAFINNTWEGAASYGCAQGPRLGSSITMHDNRHEQVPETIDLTVVHVWEESCVICQLPEWIRMDITRSDSKTSDISFTDIVVGFQNDGPMKVDASVPFQLRDAIQKCGRITAEIQHETSQIYMKMTREVWPWPPLPGKIPHRSFKATVNALGVTSGAPPPRNDKLNISCD